MLGGKVVDVILKVVVKLLKENNDVGNEFKIDVLRKREGVCLKEMKYF